MYTGTSTSICTQERVRAYVHRNEYEHMYTGTSTSICTQERVRAYVHRNENEHMYTGTSTSICTQEQERVRAYVHRNEYEHMYTGTSTSICTQERVRAYVHRNEYEHMHAQKRENTIPTSRPEVLGYHIGSCMLPVAVRIPFCCCRIQQWLRGACGARTLVTIRVPD